MQSMVRHLPPVSSAWTPCLAVRADKPVMPLPSRHESVTSLCSFLITVRGRATVRRIVIGVGITEVQLHGVEQDTFSAE